jgi:hypothetical protein
MTLIFSPRRNLIMSGNVPRQFLSPFDLRSPFLRSAGCSHFQCVNISQCQLLLLSVNILCTLELCQFTQLVCINLKLDFILLAFLFPLHRFMCRSLKSKDFPWNCKIKNFQQSICVVTCYWGKIEHFIGIGKDRIYLRAGNRSLDRQPSSKILHGSYSIYKYFIRPSQQCNI